MSEIRAGALLNYILLVLQTGIPLVLTPFLMDGLGVAEYGVYMLACTVMARLYMSDLGRTTTTRFLSEYQSRGDAAGAAAFLGNISLLYVLAGGLILLLGLGVYPWLGSIFSQFSESELRTYEVLYLMMLGNAAIMFPLRSLIGVADARQRFVVPTLIALVAALVSAGGILLLLRQGWRSEGLLAYSIVVGLLAMGCNVVYCFVRLGARIHFSGWSRALCHTIIVFSFWMFLNQLINLLNAGTGNYIVAMTRGSVESGVYTNGLQIYGWYFMLAGVLTTLFLPRVVKMVVKGASPAEQTDAMIRLGRWQLMLLGGVFFFVLFFGREFFGLWVGHIPGADAEMSWLIAVTLVVPQTFVLVQSLGWQITQARDALRQRVLITGFNSLLFIVVSWFVCQYLGLRAQAIWAAVSILIQLAMINFIHYRGLGLHIGRFYRETFRRALPCAVLLAGACLLLNLIPTGGWGMLALRSALLALIYIPTVYFLYATQTERAAILRR